MYRNNRPTVSLKHNEGEGRDMKCRGEGGGKAIYSSNST